MAETSDEDKSELAVNSLQKQQQQRRRGPGRPFKPGKSGNPEGRPHGRRNNTTLAAEALLDGESELLTRRAIELAKRGHPIALKLCLERIMAPRRDRPINLEIPPITSAADLAAAISTVLHAVASGEITPGEGEIVMQMLASARSVFEGMQLHARLKALEEKMAQRHG